MRVHKVGTLTLGVMLILFGVLFLVHLGLGLMTYQQIFSFWPVAFLLLGIEVLLSTLPKTQERFVLDGKAVALLCVLLLFAVVMAAAELSLEWMALEISRRPY